MPDRRKKFILAVDLGSTYFKAGVFSDGLGLVGAGSHHLKYLERDVRVEISSDQVLLGARKAVAAALAASGIDAAKDLGGIGITSQAQTFALFDGRNRNLTPFLSWEDMRSTRECGEMRKDALFSDFSEQSGVNELLPCLQICQLRRLRNSGICGKGSNLRPLPSHLICLLGGKNITDNNIAAMSGLFSLRSGKWNSRYLGYCGIGPSNMPGLIRVGEMAAETSESAGQFGLPPGIPVYSCGNDQTAGAYGARLGQGMFLVTLGSAQVIYQRTATMPPPGRNIIRGGYPGRGFYRLATGPFGGNLISRLIGSGTGIASYDEFFALAERQYDSGGKCNCLKIDESGGSLSWKKGASREEIACSALVYLCARMNEMHDMLSPSRSRCSGKILVGGGGSRNPLWIRMLGKELGRKLVPVETDPLLGAARMVSKRI